MCTYATVQCPMSGSAKSTIGWFPLSTATVYFDHPVHADAAHTLNIDFAAPERGAAARVAVELRAESAVRLVTVVAEALLSAPVEISGLTADQRDRLQRLFASAEGDPRDDAAAAVMQVGR